MGLSTLYNSRTHTACDLHYLPNLLEVESRSKFELSKRERERERAYEHTSHSSNIKALKLHAPENY